MDTTDSVETHGTKQIIELDGPIAGPEAMAVMPSLNKIIQTGATWDYPHNLVVLANMQDH